MPSKDKPLREREREEREGGVFFYVCVYASVHMCAIAHVRRSEENLQEKVPRIKLKLPRLGGKHPYN